MDLYNVRQELIDKVFLGVVEDTYDPKRRGRIKIRIDKLYGLLSSVDHVPTEDIPWASPELTQDGVSFGIPSLGKVLYVTFVDGDWNKPIFYSAEHYNTNLQQKLQDMSDEQYLGFGAMNYDDKHQHYVDIDQGLMIDFVKSNINMRNNGDIRVNLRDNSSKLFLGTEDASEPAVLGNHWMTWFDEFVDNFIGLYGGPYLGNLAAPVIPHPKMIEVLNKYKAIRATFLSDHVFITDDQRVIAQKREYDNPQSKDNYNDETQLKVPEIRQSTYVPEERVDANEIPSEDVPVTEASENMTTAKIPNNPTPDESKRLKNPAPNDIKNGEIELSKLTISKELAKTFSGINDDRKYLINEVAISLDEMIDAYKLEKDSDWSNVIAIKGYHNIERQKNIRALQPSTAPLVGNDPFGFANQVELYWGIQKRKIKTINEVKKYLKDKNKTISETSVNEVKILNWLTINGKNFGWRNAGRTNTDENQWWSWIYDPSILPKTQPKTTEEIEDTTIEEDIKAKPLSINPFIENSINYGKNNTYSSGSIQEFKIDLNIDSGDWDIIGVEYSSINELEGDVEGSINLAIKKNGKQVIVNILDFITDELGSEINISSPEVNMKFTIIANPILNNGSIDSSRKQASKTFKSLIKLR